MHTFWGWRVGLRHLISAPKCLRAFAETRTAGVGFVHANVIAVAFMRKLEHVVFHHLVATMAACVSALLFCSQVLKHRSMDDRPFFLAPHVKYEYQHRDPKHVVSFNSQCANHEECALPLTLSGRTRSNIPIQIAQPNLCRRLSSIHMNQADFWRLIQRCWCRSK